MKKRSKWTKWKVGAVGALGLSLLFQGVKASPAFDQAVANAHNPKITSDPHAVSQASDSLLDDWSATDDSGSGSQTGSGNNSQDLAPQRVQDQPPQRYDSRQSQSFGGSSRQSNTFRTRTRQS